MRMFYVIFDLLQPSHYLYSLDAKSTIYDRLISVFTSVLSSAPGVKNFNLKSIFLQTLFKILLQRAQPSLVATSSSLQVLYTACKAEWASQEERTKQLLVVLKHLNHMIDNKLMIIGENNVADFDKFMLGAFDLAHKEKKE